METTKLCPRCNETKSTDQFHYNKKLNKLAWACKSCVNTNTRKWQERLFYSIDPNDILEATFYKMLQTSRSNAKTKGLTYTLSLQDLRDIYKKQEGKCFYTGVPMSLRSNNHLDRDPLLISLDRYTSTLGYTQENTVLCCWGCNALKGYHSTETFYSTLNTLYQGAHAIGKI